MTNRERARWIMEQCGEAMVERVFLPLIERRVKERQWGLAFTENFELAIRRGASREAEARLIAWYQTRAEKVLPDSVRRELHGPDTWELELEQLQAENRIAAQEAGTELGLHDHLSLGQSCAECDYVREDA